MSKGEPQPDSGFKVENQSDRVWVFGYLRMIPFAIFVVGVLSFVIVSNTGFGFPHRLVAALWVFLVLGVPFILDRSPFLDPVDFVQFGNVLQVKRLAGNRTWALSRVRAVEFAPVEGADYDESGKAGRHQRVTLRLSWAWPAPRFLATDSAVARITTWANTHSIAVHTRSGE